MPPRFYLCTQCLYPLSRRHPLRPFLAKYLSTISTAATPSPPPFPPPQAARYAPTQPPSHRPPEFRKSQLHRQYTSLLRSTPLMLFFQHNNLKSVEWMSVRRVLTLALRAVDASLPASSPLLADSIKVNIIQTRIFESALLVVEHFHPELISPGAAPFTHGLSSAAHDAVAANKSTHPLAPLLLGPLAIVSFPVVTPSHLKAALSILAPSAASFPAPTRRSNPGYYDPVVQGGLQKLLLLGARVEGQVFDTEGARWVGGIEGGLEGLRARLVGILGGVGAGVTGVLEGQGRSLYFTLEGRRGMLEDGAGDGEGNGKEKDN